LHLGTSSLRIFAALFVSFVTAVPLGLFLGLSPRADRVARPLIYLTYPVPKIVLLPLVLLFFGLGDMGKIVMLSLILFYQLLITTRDAARSVSRAARYSLYSLGGTRRHLFVHVIWPSCLPAIFTALRIATGTVVAVLFFVESIGTRYGMGFYILDAWSRADVPQIFVGIVVLALLGVILYETFDVLEKVFCRWNQL
jgi:NitT/TauT family transport system permease protein